MAKERQQNDGSEKLIVVEQSFYSIEDGIDPPPPNLASKFKTVQEWMLNICTGDRPQKPIATYRFSLFESPNDYILALVGENTDHTNKKCSVSRIEFEAENMYFRLPESYYKSLDRQQLIDKLTSSLKDFASTAHFRNSFFAKAEVVIFETNGQVIWSRQE